MKLLLDENLPKKLKQDLQDVEVCTVREMDWNGKSKGVLIKLMMEEKFDVLLTFDKNLEHQQNFQKFPLTVLALNAPDNTYQTLKVLIRKIKEKFSEQLKVGVTEIKL